MTTYVYDLTDPRHRELFLKDISALIPDETGRTKLEEIFELVTDLENERDELTEQLEDTDGETSHAESERDEAIDELNEARDKIEELEKQLEEATR